MSDVRTGAALLYRPPLAAKRSIRATRWAILVRFEWHDECPTSGPGPPSYTVHPSPPNDRSVQQGGRSWFALNGTMNVRRQDRGRPPIQSTPRRQTIDPCNKVGDLGSL